MIKTPRIRLREINCTINDGISGQPGEAYEQYQRYGLGATRLSDDTPQLAATSNPRTRRWFSETLRLDRDDYLCRVLCSHVDVAYPGHGFDLSRAQP